ncbi:hypothetical protein IMCC3088_311 [Aequoribacter fuscus]|uniref:Transposase n=1 Tax=Aequoribacter fuscus TaxID=2518989 RepID=F3L5N1_9GAMM|nr:hypothetical protein IMCC3088_311 [Aequoribacter fuscus]
MTTMRFPVSISSGTLYNWRSKYAGLEVNEANQAIVHSV